MLAGRPGGLGQHRAVYPARVTGPARGLIAGQRVADLGAVAVLVKLAVVDDVGLRAGRVQQADQHVTAAALVVPQDRPPRDNPGSGGHQRQRSAVTGVPHEPAADRAAQLQLITRAQFLGQVRRDFAVVEPFDRDGDRLAVGRGDRLVTRS